MTNTTDPHGAARYTIEELERDVRDWLKFGPPREVQDTAHHQLVETLVSARKAADPDLPAARVIHQFTQADTNAYLEDSWYSAAGEPIDDVSDQDQEAFREEVRREIADCPQISRVLTGCLDRAFERYSARRHGEGPGIPSGEDIYGSDAGQEPWPDPEGVPDILLDEFDDEVPIDQPSSAA